MLVLSFETNVFTLAYAYTLIEIHYSEKQEPKLF